MRRGSSTLIIGTEDEKVDAAITTIRDSVSPASEPGINRATLFVLKVEHCHPDLARIFLAAACDRNSPELSFLKFFNPVNIYADLFSPPQIRRCPHFWQR